MARKPNFNRHEVATTAERVVERNRGSIAAAASSAKENAHWMRLCRYPERGTFWDMVADAVLS